MPGPTLHPDIEMALGDRHRTNSYYYYSTPSPLDRAAL
jgi:hypothetical protein